MGATCKSGQYLYNGTCTVCNSGAGPYYCPGDDTRHACPTTDTDYDALTGWTMTYRQEGTWALLGANTDRHCRSGNRFIDTYGNSILTEFPFNGENYWGTSGDYIYYYKAGPGMYLSEYRSTSGDKLYRYAKQCTNAPAHAHYTGPGTPDAPDGSVMDANDCPWVCDDGYGRIGNVCHSLCTAGITTIHAGDVVATLWATRHTTPALVVRTAGGMCYANLIIGTGAGIRVIVGDKTYRVE